MQHEATLFLRVLFIAEETWSCAHADKLQQLSSLKSNLKSLRVRLMSTPTTTPPAIESDVEHKSNEIESTSDHKVKVHFVAVGNAPILKRSKFKIDSHQNFAYVATSLRRTLKLESSSDELFLYLHSAFCPSPQDTLGMLEECFNVRGELVVHYSLKEAWG